ncbi:hypothetical protein HMPREF1486_02566 [Streptomyces sp. HPH0547]|nr:hypothetical protein HMPREF1486_02566 [Streptomyces sp. HPH0547]GHJ19364.1 hypothetical protein TPA0909_09780 [Streptomyces albus]
MITPMTRPPAVGVPGYSQSLRCEAQSARRARRLVEVVLAAWQLDSLSGTACLVVSELVANAVKHTESTTVRVGIIRVGPRRVRIGVSDTSAQMPLLKPFERCATSGRGLHLVAEAAVRWGVDQGRWGKTVWAELSGGQPPGALL